VAVVLVLLNHAQIPFVPGGYIGVDVFYVLSGFLITGLVVREIEREGRLSIRDFYARRAKRILPLAATVLVFVGIVSLFVYGTVRQVDVGGDILAAALFVINWHFIAQGVDYFAVEEGLVSPLQHYWTLAVEEQFYVVWPWLLMLSGAIAIKAKRNLKPIMLGLVVPITIASLVYGLFYTESDPNDAFFSTLARGWELAFGAILAILLPKVVRLPKGVTTALAVTGLGVILATAYLMTESDPFPGWRALLPVLATVALLVAGASTSPNLVARLFSTAPFQYIGKISYSMYLWHWPFVVFAIAIWGDLSPAWLTLVTLISVIPAAVSHKLIEEPIHHSKILALKPKRALAVGGVCIVAGVGVGLALSTDRLSIEVLPEGQARGARVLNNGEFPIQNKVEAIRPDPLVANDDRGQAYEDGCLILSSTVESPECVYGDPDSDTTVVLFGDSHALQYAPALTPIAEEKGWRLVVLTRGNCTPADVDIGSYCNEWRDNTIQRILDEDPDMIVMATSTTGELDMTTEDGEELVAPDSVPFHEEGMIRTIEELKPTGATMVMMGDQVQAPFLPDQCVGENLDNLRECAFPNEPRPGRYFDKRAAEATDIELISPVSRLCTDELCPSVIGNVLVYRDTYHMSATYAETLAPWLGRKLPVPGS
jgi:peptidoglycan/LPS O-acetylase OafA/YrhL